MFLILKVQWFFDFDIYSITQKYKKSGAFSFRLKLSLKTWVGVVGIEAWGIIGIAK